MQILWNWMFSIINVSFLEASFDSNNLFVIARTCFTGLLFFKIAKIYLMRIIQMVHVYSYLSSIASPGEQVKLKIFARLTLLC